MDRYKLSIPRGYRSLDFEAESYQIRISVPDPDSYDYITRDEALKIMNFLNGWLMLTGASNG